MTRSCEQREAGNDMVEYLRKQGMDDIADEIERLREALAFAQAALLTIKGTLEEGRHDAPPFRVTDVAPSTPR